MLEAIMVPVVCGLFIGGFLKLFELFVCKKERLALIEKMGDKITPDMLQSKISFSSIGNLSFCALKVGCLLIGLGLGILVAFFIHYNMMDFCDDRRIQSSLYISCVLLFGGIGLLTAFLIELKINKNK